MDELVSKKPIVMTATNAKMAIIKPTPTPAEIIEYIEVINMMSMAITRVHLHIQSNGGANTSITNDITNLHHTTKIVPYKIGGIRSGITCTHKGVFYLNCKNKEVLPVRMFLSAKAPETVISPTDIVTYNESSYNSWTLGITRILL